MGKSKPTSNPQLTRNTTAVRLPSATTINNKSVDQQSTKNSHVEHVNRAISEMFGDSDDDIKSYSSHTRIKVSDKHNVVQGTKSITLVQSIQKSVTNTLEKICHADQPKRCASPDLDTDSDAETVLAPICNDEGDNKNQNVEKNMSIDTKTEKPLTIIPETDESEQEELEERSKNSNNNMPVFPNHTQKVEIAIHSSSDKRLNIAEYSKTSDIINYKSHIDTCDVFSQNLDGLSDAFESKSQKNADVHSDDSNITFYEDTPECFRTTGANQVVTEGTKSEQSSNLDTTLRITTKGAVVHNQCDMVNLISTITRPMQPMQNLPVYMIPQGEGMEPVMYVPAMPVSTQTALVQANSRPIVNMNQPQALPPMSYGAPHMFPGCGFTPQVVYMMPKPKKHKCSKKHLSKTLHAARKTLTQKWEVTTVSSPTINSESVQQNESHDSFESALSQVENLVEEQKDNAAEVSSTKTEMQQKTSQKFHNSSTSISVSSDNERIGGEKNEISEETTYSNYNQKVGYKRRAKKNTQKENGPRENESLMQVSTQEPSTSYGKRSLVCLQPSPKKKTKLSSAKMLVPTKKNIQKGNLKVKKRKSSDPNLQVQKKLREQPVPSTPPLTRKIRRRRRRRAMRQPVENTDTDSTAKPSSPAFLRSKFACPLQQLSRKHNPQYINTCPIPPLVQDSRQGTPETSPDPSQSTPESRQGASETSPDPSQSTPESRQGASETNPDPQPSTPETSPDANQNTSETSLDSRQSTSKPRSEPSSNTEEQLNSTSVSLVGVRTNEAVKELERLQKKGGHL